MDMNLFTQKLITDHPVVLEPVEELPTTAAVLVTLFQRMNRTHILLIKRARHLRLHAGEISFPGGVYESKDETLLMTALRETREEIEMDIQPERVMARLPHVVTRTGFEVNPFVCMLDELPSYKINRAEVEEVLEAPLVPLLTTHHRDVGHPREKEMVAYWYKKHRIWGATAKILHQIGRLGSIL